MFLFLSFHSLSPLYRAGRVVRSLISLWLLSLWLSTSSTELCTSVCVHPFQVVWHNFSSSYRLSLSLRCTEPGAWPGLWFRCDSVRASRSVKSVNYVKIWGPPIIFLFLYVPLPQLSLSLSAISVRRPVSDFNVIAIAANLVNRVAYIQSACTFFVSPSQVMWHNLCVGFHTL